jgi:DNA-binding transcriptional MerR regulator
MLPISVVAHILGVHQRTLRIYDEENILKPERTSKRIQLVISKFSWVSE